MPLPECIYSMLREHNCDAAASLLERAGEGWLSRHPGIAAAIVSSQCAESGWEAREDICKCIQCFEARRAGVTGPGRALTEALARLGISYTPGCSCADRAKTMDSWGPDVCEQRLDEIVGWLREEAEKRGLPFFAPVARLLVKRAIAKARKTTLE